MTEAPRVLTARSSIDDKVRGLDIGADDYLTKPFELEELLARLRALIRRGHQVKDPMLRVHDLELDTASRTVKRAGQPIHLTPREYALLEFLAYNRGKVVSRTKIWEHLYDEHDENTSNVVDVYIRYLRNKIDKGFDPPLILTRWGDQVEDSRALARLLGVEEFIVWKEPMPHRVLTRW